ncbi:hypothetical protein B0H66DRAFT_349294 [Apodospora peruviana]|uniref:Uncharacterized protein n=1 Tax=Apodospora peruviana TaxID=516989 RepID=A0AAE0HVK2_9PEZI|nr:hypothetical protein B0H66DRAFT_349294 [Apodospora peruviana]
MRTSINTDTLPSKRSFYSQVPEVDGIGIQGLLSHGYKQTTWSALSWCRAAKEGWERKRERKRAGMMSLAGLRLWSNFRGGQSGRRPAAGQLVGGGGVWEETWSRLKASMRSCLCPLTIFLRLVAKSLTRLRIDININLQNISQKHGKTNEEILEKKEGRGSIGEDPSDRGNSLQVK